MTDYEAAFIEVKDAVQPDSDPAISYGDGETADPEKELDRILERCKTATWEASTEEEPVTIRFGEKRLPTTGNGHIYKAVQGGAAGETEPAWGVSDYSRVSDGTVVWEEAGYFVGSPYDTRTAIRKLCELKADKCGDRVDFSADGASYKETQTAEYWLNKARRYASVGIA